MSRGESPVLPDLSNVRGVNYVPSWANNSVDQWLNYDRGVAAENLDVLRAFGVNGVRVFGNYEVWRSDPTSYAGKLAHLLAAALERRMLTLLVLFDSVGHEPSGDLAADATSSGRWIKSPSAASLRNPAFATDARAYLDDTLAAVDDALSSSSGPPLEVPIVFDVWNEPSGSVDTRPFELFAALISQLKSAAPHPVTIGFAFAQSNNAVLSTLGDVLDVVSFHPYGVFEALVQAETSLARNIAAQHGGIPVLATEGGFPGFFQSYFQVAKWFRRAQTGFFLWEAFAAESPFSAGGGIFYPQRIAGERVFVRDLEGANSLLTLAIDDGFAHEHVATLRAADDPEHVPYPTVPYGFTTADAHRLLSDWEASYGVVHPSLSADPSTEGFYSTLVTWTALSLDRLSLADASLEGQLVKLKQSFATGVLTDTEQLLSQVANQLAASIETNQLAEPANSPPIIADVRVTTTASEHEQRVDIVARVLVLEPDAHTDVADVVLLLFSDDDEFQGHLPLTRIENSGVYELQVTAAKSVLKGQNVLVVAVDQQGQIGTLWHHPRPGTVTPRSSVT